MSERTTKRSASDSTASSSSAGETAARSKAIMYTHPECGYCSLLKEEFAQDGVEYEEIDVSKQPEKWDEVQRLTGGDRITPVTLMPDGNVRIGFKGIGCAF